VCLEVLDYKSK